ncbi:Apoptotic ATPase [Handroanthus impetiginosus]|uniref:Apoptotic ATPase n=1 Tax=Handroanthus impetiginosus TaxID=429701 RepID=A0A2G9HJG7_9LAMI|nr:Apoptotic ATPase [Handroanthus impetiginosus]
MVDAVLQVAIDKTASLLMQEGKIIFQIKKGIDEVKEMMKSLKSYLKDAESKADQNPEVATLVTNMRDLFQDIENILDTYRTKIEPDDHMGGPLGCLKWASRVVRNCMEVHKIDQEILKLKSRAEVLINSKGDLKPESDAAVASADTEVWSERRKFLYADHRAPKNMVGREKDLRDLTEEMSKEAENDTVITTIVGPGGVGKTIFARKLYESLEERLKPTCCAKVYVSQKRNADEILRDIAEKVKLDEWKTKANLENDLYLHLQDKRYLIFLDDVWDPKIWNKLKDTLMIKSEKGSRIIVTSRSREVSRSIVGTAGYFHIRSIPFPLDVLSEDDAWTLFEGMISHKNNSKIEPPLQEIGKEIMKRCGGLPLAIEVVVGMLHAKPRNVPAWTEVQRKMSEINENDCLKVLALSYNDLPTHSKPLFLYLGIFPENHEIFVPQLVPLWVAENFVQDDGKQDDYVEQRINDLNSRNLLRVSRRKSDGKIRSFRIHSLVRDLCRRLAEKSNYFCTRNNLNSSDIDQKMQRRVTTSMREPKKYALKEVELPKLRALFCFTKDDALFKFLKCEAPRLEYLRLLIIEIVDGKVVEVPENIAQLSGLIYLKMVGNISEIPESIRRLKRLQTLEIRSKDIPVGILKMKQVKHLFLSCSIVVEKTTYNLSNCLKHLRDANKKHEDASIPDLKSLHIDIPNLQSLDVDFGPNFSLSSRSIQKFDKLKRLGIYVWTKKMLDDAFGPDQPVLLNCLEDLKLHIYVSLFNDSPILKLYRYKTLKKLKLYFDKKCELRGDVELFPRSVVKISLKMVDKIEDHVDKLKTLPNLESLKLNKCRGQQLDFSGDGFFPQLQVLVLKYTAFQKLLCSNDMPRLARFVYVPAPLSHSPIPDGRLKELMQEDEEERGLWRGDSMKSRYTE